MKLTTRTVLMTLMLAASASAMAAPHLTPRECNDYPFRPANGDITHKQLMRELAELEAQGYNPGADNASYPADIEAAQKKLMAQYRTDCLPAQPINSAQGSGNAATSTPPVAPNVAS